MSEKKSDYDTFAAAWIRSVESGINHTKHYLETPAMWTMLGDPKGLRVLALGCGTGEECDLLSKAGATVVGVDLSHELIAYAQNKYSDIDFRVMDMEKLDFPTESFDVVYASLVMHYVPSWEQTLKNISHVLKKGGRFIFSTHHPATWGAERSRNVDERRSLLGYIKYYKTNTCTITGDYLNPHMINDVWFSNFKVSYYHRPFADMMKDLLGSDLALVDVKEPKPVEESHTMDPLFWEIHQKIPTVILFELKKP